ncbi:MAG TPA: dTDP-4-dehydrorhamnose 3,5-epimerase [Rubricoccaceae bacterium]|nr:dTDP-4-dehydrorhamnose 3,5-epimerase [Rubricoccaceae bacterium]
MTTTETALPGVLLLEPRVFGDARGYFLETYHAARYREAGVEATFVQDNHSHSRWGTLRGLHFQRRRPQGKLVQVVRGAVFDVVVDVRPGSAHFGQWIGVELSGENHRQLWVPPGFAHGFCVLTDEADFLYKCTAYYDPTDEGGVRWDDPDLAVAWPIEAPMLSDKDRALPLLRDLGPQGLPAVSAAPATAPAR